MLQQYQMWDYTPQKGGNYYRIRQVDFDGSYSYSPIATVFLDSGKEEAIVFPNPVEDFLSIQLPASLEGEVRVQLYDSYRRIVWERVIDQASSAVERFELPELSTGLYILKLRGKRYRSYHPLVFKQLD